MVIAILFSNASYAEVHMGTICENNGGIWSWSGEINDWDCSSQDKEFIQRFAQERALRKQIDLQNEPIRQREQAQATQRNQLRDEMLKRGQILEAYQVGLIDRDRLRVEILKRDQILKAYELGLIDRDIARAEMLKRGQILEAYEAKLIDKDTASLYLQKQAMENATRASENQTAAARRAANAAEDANTPNLLNQSLQNIQNYNQMNQMINQQNINSNMRRYY